MELGYLDDLDCLEPDEAKDKIEEFAQHIVGSMQLAIENIVPVDIGTGQLVRLEYDSQELQEAIKMEQEAYQQFVADPSPENDKRYQSCKCIRARAMNVQSRQSYRRYVTSKANDISTMYACTRQARSWGRPSRSPTCHILW